MGPSREFCACLKLRRTSLKKSEIYERMANNAFPKSLPFGKRARGWLGSEIDESPRA